MQQARLKSSEEMLLFSHSEYNTAVVYLEIDYEDGIIYGDNVTIEARIPEIGFWNFTMKYAVFADGERAAVGESIQVVTNEKMRDSVGIPSQ